MKTERLGYARLRERLVVALDHPEPGANQALVDAFGDRVQWYKVGLSRFVRLGSSAVTSLVRTGRNVFLDLKFHDIPNTVAGAVTAAASLGASWCTVHAAGGAAMLRAAAEAAETAGDLRVLAVTVLTSQAGEVADEVLDAADRARAAGCHGVICSPREAAAVRAQCGPGFLVVTPGIRLAARGDDQARISTPSAALAAGADYIVVGRPLYAAPEPLLALDVLSRAVESDVG